MTKDKLEECYQRCVDLVVDFDLNETIGQLALACANLSKKPFVAEKEVLDNYAVVGAELDYLAHELKHDVLELDK